MKQSTGLIPNRWIQIPWLFPDYSLTFPWLVVKNPQLSPDSHFTYLQKEVKKMELNR